MAIVVEEENRSSSFSIVSLIMWLVVLAVVGLSVYYLFFKRPELIPIKTPSNLEGAESLSKIKLEPDVVLKDPLFTRLRSDVQPPSIEGAGKVNPLLGF